MSRITEIKKTSSELKKPEAELISCCLNVFLNWKTIDVFVLQMKIVNMFKSNKISAWKLNDFTAHLDKNSQQNLTINSFYNRSASLA